MSTVSNASRHQEAAELLGAIAAANRRLDAQDVKIRDCEARLTAAERETARIMQEQAEVSRARAEQGERLTQLQGAIENTDARQRLIRQRQVDNNEGVKKIVAVVLGIFIILVVGLGITYGVIKLV